jgi:site-specific recombinase XerD
MPLFARDLIAVQQLLGYAQPETTAVYARVGGLISGLRARTVQDVAR